MSQNPLVTNQAAKPDAQDEPWEPVIDSSSSKAEKQAAAYYTDYYGGTPLASAPDDGAGLLGSYNIPYLGMAYADPYPFVVNAPPGSGSSSPPQTNDSVVLATKPVVHIDLAALQATEQTCLNLTTDAMDEFNELREKVASATTASSFFGQLAGYHTLANTNSTGTIGAPVTNYDILDQEGQDFAKTMIPQLEYLMQQGAGIIELMGVLDALLNNTGQMYTSTDIFSAMELDTGVPSNYDNVTLTVDMESLNTAANAIYQYCTNINNALGYINNILSGLALAWTGPSSDEAQTAANDWNSMMTTLFGTKADPDAGILNILAGGLLQAVQNYSTNEQAIGMMFSYYWDQVNGDPSGNVTTDSSGNLVPIRSQSSGPPPDQNQDITNWGTPYPYATTAVDESFRG
jgi:uncharacterized protein YukE